MKFLLLFILFLFSCTSLQKKGIIPKKENINIPFSEFKKILNTKSPLYPLPGGEESLVLMSFPGDEYIKLYSLNHSTKKFKLKLDVKRSIKSLSRDYTKKHYFFSLDNYGDENYQIYKLDLETNKYEKLFGKNKARATIADYSNNGKYIYIRSNHENEKIYRIYKLNLSNKKIEAISPENISFDGIKVDYQDKKAALYKAHGNNEIHLYMLDVENKELQKVFSKKKTMYIPSFFHPHENKLYLNTDHESDRIGCAFINLNAPKKINWARKKSNKDIECYYGRLRKLSYYYESFDGRLKLRVFESVYEKELEFPFPENAFISQFSVVPFSNTGIVRIMSSNSPGEYYSFDLAKGKNAKLTKISKLNRSIIKETELASSYDLYYKSYDGLKIHGIIFAKKSWLNDNKKRPVIVWPHGGPDSNEIHNYHPFFQYWALNGFVVFAPNFRGSMGYGKKFETLNDKDWGGGHIKDLIYGKKEIEKLSYIDPKRIYIVGASFGGFSTLSAIVQYPTEFRAAVAIVAIANLFTFMKSIPQTSNWLSEFETEIGNMVKDKDLYYERSPYFHADKIKIPLKIYQAENDVRTVKEEMDEFTDLLKEYNIPHEYEVLKKEGHSLSRTESWEKVLAGTVEFLNRNK